MKYLSSIFLAFIFLNIFVWHWVIVGAPKDKLDIYFLDVGQGDSSLILLPYGPKVLIDGGPGKNVLAQLDKVLPPQDRYIDLVILSHPQLDHFSGLISVLDRYDIGAFIYNGRDGEISAWQDLTNVLKEKKIPTLFLEKGDNITYKNRDLKILSPNKNLLSSKELNDTTVVALVESEGVTALFTGDIGFNVENELVESYDMNIDLLKVAHHGSKYSSGAKFLSEATPLVSVIQVGDNKYGHPTKEAIERLIQVGSNIYRNDSDGTVHIEGQNGRLNIFKER